MARGDDVIHARLRGLSSAVPREKRIVRPGDPRPEPDPTDLPLPIHDARAFQASAGPVAELFEGHGFALVEGVPPVERHGDKLSAGYDTAIEAMLRDTLFAGRRIEIGPHLLPVFRGGPEDAIYAEWVHQDFGLVASDLALNLAGILSPEAARAWQVRYERDDVEGCVAISCWRTLGMHGPLRHMPLALCDPASVAMVDVIPATSSRTGDNYHIGLRYDPAQRWYSYAGMTADELLAFKLFDCRKADPRPERLRSVFHTAFEDPNMPANAERRHSCEYRVVVLLLRQPS